MVDKDKIREALRSYYDVYADHVIRDDGTVDVIAGTYGGVSCKRLPPDRVMPVQFGTVTGDFEIQTGLRPVSLVGSPHTVGGVFHIHNNNRIVDLQGGPRSVGKYVVGKGNRINSLVGVASHVTQGLVIHEDSLWSLEHLPPALEFLYVGYHEHLPVLRSVLVTRAYFTNAYVGLQNIVDKYMGRGQSVMLNFALELKKAGYGTNAKW